MSPRQSCANQFADVPLGGGRSLGSSLGHLEGYPGGVVGFTTCLKSLLDALVEFSDLGVHLTQELVCDETGAAGSSRSSVHTDDRGSTSPLERSGVAAGIATRAAAAVTLTVLSVMGTRPTLIVSSILIDE
jgi:hypothetical protein